ncbi:translation initiation factor 4G [Fusarium austroafricanum]|uniref:Translation initiation factor 4G n=1 Tax=Fusarium austroafricanum TaxID=2364996 RepID=A0A8H4K145_9HYPO|nr:translation initiation factor 4G [Fusarium austroafricanum]
MTSPANQQNPIPANNTPATTASSYASAAGAPKKSAQAPIVATGSHPPAVVGASSSSQNAKDASSSPVNGKPAVTPAVPTVTRSSVNLNGSDHSRKSSVTMAANGPNSFVANGGPVTTGKPGIQFGYDSPAMASSTPQSSSAAPIPIPGSGNARVPSPAHSPSPIPQPSASGGRPPSGLQQAGGTMTFGSLGSDGERHMRQGSAPTNPNAQPGAHFRRESGHSAQGDGAGRGNFQPQGGRGRGYNPHGNNFNQQMGYPPNNQFRSGPGQGRGMPPAFQPQPRNMPYPNSPQPARSPALVPSMPNTPNMQTATMQPNMAMQTPPQYHYPPPMAQQHQQVQYPLSQVDKYFSKNSKKNKQKRGDLEKSVQVVRPQDSSRDLHSNEFNQRRRFSKRSDQPWREQDTSSTRVPSSSYPPNPHSALCFKDPPAPFDLSPEGGWFDYLLTLKNQNYGYPPGAPQVDGYGRPLSMQYGYNNMPYMSAPPNPNSPGYAQNFVAPYTQHSHNMSRTPSQPERPPSASQQNTPLIVSSTPQPQSSSLKPTANSFVKVPKKSAAIQIKNAAGEVIDTSSFKTPSSPAPSVQQSKTPPVIASSTPPPKPSTPSHGRTDSHAAPKTAKQIQDELKEKIKQATQAPSKEDKPKPAEQPAAKAEDKPAEKSEVKPAETKAEPVPAAKAESESKPEPEAKAPESAPKTEEPQKEAEKPAEPAKNDEPDEDEMERMIREMEEEDARREKAEEEHRKKVEAQKALAKEQAEKDRAKNAAEEDRKLREQEREMERLEEEKEKRRQEAESSGGSAPSVAELLSKARSGKVPELTKVESVTDKLANMKIGGDKSADAPKQDKRGAKPAALNLTPLNTKPVEPAQPSAALQSLKSARFLKVIEQDIYPAGIKSPNPALNAAVQKKGKTFKYDANFLLQFQKVFTEQPSLEFGQQVKSLIGDDRSRTNTPGGSGRGSHRGPSSAASGFPMGTFHAPTASRTLPSNSTSELRFALSNQARPGSMGSMGRSSSGFPTGGSRGPSQLPGSPRGSRRGGGGNSKRGQEAKEAQAAKTMPLTAGQELKPIAQTANGWKPTSVGKNAGAAAAPAGHLEPDMVQRKVKAALNKMTPEKFDRIADQILLIASQSKDESDGRTLRQVIQLTFEKATDEAHWASMYAKFCKRMLETMSPDVRDERIKDKNGNVVSGGNLFRKYLLNRCQEEFERGWTVNLPEKPEEEDESAGKKTGEAALLSDEYYAAAAAKRRGLGLVQFIGELYKLGMLTERIMHECVHKLVDYKGVPDEAEVESLSKLLRTIGGNLDSTEKGRPMMDAYFQRIQTMMDLPELPSRLKFMLMDVVDLRKANWHSKETNKGPKTLDEVRAEAEAAQAAKAQEAARTNQRGGGRPPVGRGDARNFSAGYAQQTSNQVGMDDLRRLKGSANRPSSGITLGPTSMLSSRSNSGRRMGPGGYLGPRGEDSATSSRTGTPPTRENTSHSNAFSLLANMESDHPASPPSTSASPAMSKAVPDSDKKESE